MDKTMQISLESQPAEKFATDALVTYVFEGGDKDKGAAIDGLAADLDRAAGGALGRLAASGELTGKSLEMTLVHFPAGLAAQRLLLVGAAKREKFGTAELRLLASAALRHLKPRSVKRLAFLARENERGAAAAEAVTEGLLLGNFEGNAYKTDKKNGPLEAGVLLGFDAAAQSGVDRGRIIAEAQNFTRALGNEPSNRLTPRLLAERAETMAREAGLAVEILDEKRLAELKMGALLGVARGSAEPPRMMVITYTPANPKPGAPVLALVGKAVTFDTGGISIKPSADMEKMKFDMAGGAAMLGVMRVLAQLKPAVKVICVIPSVENMPGGRAQKPGDVQIAMSGKSVEVINTDAEGRLILADALHYAKQLGATHIVDAATLTGAIVVALGHVNTGVFGTDEALTAKVLACAKTAGEKMWPMPLDDDYRELIKSTIADIQNVGGRWGGAISAAWFLREFTGDTPWVHLDIAGTAWLDDAKPWMGKGGTGVAVRTLVELAMSFDGAPAQK
jgi:leucyl aminopeptidase